MSPALNPFRAKKSPPFLPREKGKQSTYQRVNITEMLSLLMPQRVELGIHFNLG
jgi:hypothetical protein